MDENYEPFDLSRMFFGDEVSLLLLAEILFRTAFMYIAALLLVRVIGKRGLGQLSPFEFLVVIAMGSAAGDPMFYPDVPLLHGVVVMAAIVMLQKLLVEFAARNDRAEHFIESVPALLIRDGAILDEELHREGLARDELMMQLREHGIANVAEVGLAYLEPSGRLSVFRSSHEQPTTAGETTLPKLELKQGPVVA
jgi:uncharacterized membrane protein YcaP (DUF421 family)